MSSYRTPRKTTRRPWGISPMALARAAGAGAAATRPGPSLSARVATQRVPRAARNVQLYLTKDVEGNRVDRQYKEAAIRKAWTITDPVTYVEPTSRANATSWILPRVTDSDYPTVDSHPRLFQTNHTVDACIDDEEATRMLSYQQHSSFIATRSGLCRIRARRFTDAAEATTDRNEVVPWGAAISYPNPVYSTVPALLTLLHPTDTSPIAHVGSGCLPIFFMDQPSPFIKPMPGVVRNVGRFGDTVRSKFRELSMVIEEFPYSGAIDAGKWSQTTSTLRTNGGFMTMPERNIDSVRIIIFKRKKDLRNPDPGQAPLMPPVFPPIPAGAYRQSPEQVDNTVDIPSNGESVMQWPSSVPGSPYQIVEDTVMSFPKFTPTGRGYNTGSATIPATAGAHDNAQLFKSYGTSSPAVSTQLDATARASRSYMDADGLPHTNRRIYFKRRYKDMGNKIRWSSGGSTNVNEGVPAETNKIPVAAVAAGVLNSDPVLVPSSAVFTEVDFCEEELFVTVLTGAYVECREFDLDGFTPVTCDGADYASTSEQLKRGWHISPASVCHPALVSIETKWWYADEPLAGRPDQFRIFDVSGNDTGQTIVMDRPDPYLPYELPQEDA